MEHADGRFCAEMFVNADRDFLHVADELIPIVRCGIVRRIFTMVPQIECDQFKVFGKRQPKRQIGVDGETIPMAGYESTAAE